MKAAQSEFGYGMELFQRGQYEVAVPHFERATELVPEFGRAYLLLGRTYLKLGRWHDALPPLRTAFRIAPEESDRETAAIVMDVFFKNVSDLDQAAQSEIMDLLKLK